MHKSLNTYKYLYRLEGFESSNTSSSLSPTTLTLSGDSSLARFKLAEGAVLVNDIAIRFILRSLRSTHTVRWRIRFKETVSHWTRIFVYILHLICLLSFLFCYAHTNAYWFLHRLINKVMKHS